MDIVLYTTGCAKCKALEQILNEKNIKYKIETNEQIMIDKGFMTAPMLEVDGKIYNYPMALQWVNQQ